MSTATAATRPQRASARYTNPTLSGRVSPSGMAFIGRVPAQDKAEDHIYLTGDDRADVKEWLALGDPLGALKIDTVARAAPLLDNTHYSPKNRPRARKGLRGITRKGRQSVLEGATVLESVFPRSSLSFVTPTCPTLSEEGQRAVNSNWGPIYDDFILEINRKLKTQRLDGFTLAGHEVQPKRWAMTGVVGMHTHLVFPNKARGSKKWIVTIPEIRAAWVRSLAKYAPEVKAIPWVQVKVIEVKKSLRHYLAKYMSKGSQVTQSVIDAGKADQLPYQWWAQGRRLKRLVDRLTARLPQDACDALWELARNPVPGKVLSAREVTITQADGSEMVVGYALKLTDHYRDQLLTRYAELPPPWLKPLHPREISGMQ